MGLFSSSNKKYTELICDIGNKSVGIALVEYTFGENTPNIIFSERLYSNSRREKDLENTLSVLTKDLNVLLYNVLSHSVINKIKPDKIYCFYSSPWYVAQTHILKVKQVEPLVFTQQVLNKILEETEHHFLSSKDNKSSSVETSNLVLAEKRVTNVKLNGYSTHNPFGKKAKEIEVSVFLSAILEETGLLVEDSIKRIWKNIPIEHHTFPVASFSILKTVFNTFGSFLLVHIAGDVTDLSLVHDNKILDTVSFPMGKVSIVERIEKECNLDYELALSAFSMYIKDEIHPENTTRLNQAIDQAKKDWTAHFENSCSLLMKNTIIPPSVYIVASEKTLPFFEKVIKNFGFGGYLSADKELKIYPVTKDLFNKHITYSSPGNKDLFLEIETLYINLISSKEEKIKNNYILETYD
jgi:hypothetical protein